MIFYAFRRLVNRSSLRICANWKVLYRKLGVGFNAPAVIKYPFWLMTQVNPQTTYACVNFGEAVAPLDIEAAER